MQGLSDLRMHFRILSWNQYCTAEKWANSPCSPNLYVDPGQKIANRIVKPEVLVSAKPTDVDLNDEEMFIEHQNIYLGGTTKATLKKLLNEGGIIETKYHKFF